METNRKLNFLFYLAIIVFYMIAGINHFINPFWYYPLVPSYLQFPKTINSMVGGIEILGSVGLVFASTKKITANLLILMLVAFIASHWYFIQQGSCVENNICISPWIAWFRLIIIHPLLICLLFWIKKTPYGITIT